MASGEPERVETIVIGGGQAGLSVGYYLAQRGLPFVILDSNERIGDAWRNRWDSLRLFTPRRFDGLAGKPFPGPSDSFPSKDEVGDYLETFAAQFELPVRTGARVRQLTKNEEGFMVTTGDRRIESHNVVVAMGTHQVPRVPPFASDLGASVVQMHSADYRNPSQLQEGGVLVVGVGNSAVRSPSKWPVNIRRGWQEERSAMSRSGSRVPWHATWCCRCCFGSSLNGS